MFSKLQYISQGETTDVQLANISSALNGGCRWIQLRFKNGSPDDVKKLAPKVRELCCHHNATFIINDHADIARAADADGVHLGLTDMAINKAREILGPGKIIGGTANTLEDILRRAEDGCSYIGLGPYRFTQTKEELSAILGIAGYDRIMRAIEERRMTVPIYAIGGVTADDAEAIMQTGVYGIAVSAAITNHTDKKSIIDQFNSIMYEAVDHSG